MKQVVFKMNEELFKEAKIQSVKNNQNMTQYLVHLIEKDLQIKKEQTQ